MMDSKTFTAEVLSVLTSMILLAIVLFHSPLALAAPIVRWEPPAIKQDVIVGETVTISASFTALKNLSDVVVSVVPELEPYIHVSPSAYGSVSKGVAYDLDLTISAPVDASIGMYDGTIKLRSGGIYAKPLPVELGIVWPTFDGNEDLGITIDYPVGWVVRPTSRSHSMIFSNVEESSGYMEDILYAESFFQISRRVGVNQDHIPMAEWLAKISVGTSDETYSIEPLSVGGHDAVRVEVSEFGGRRAYVYILSDTDVIEVSFGLFVPEFVDEYEAMLQSLSFVQ